MAHILPWLVVLASVPACAPLAPVSGLRPEYPEARWEFVRVDSLQPTLRWEGFPRPQDRERNKEGMPGRIRQVTYDLMIWRAEVDYPQEFHREYPGELMYSRRGLPEPWHKLEEELAPSTKYFWTIRARFEVEGLPSVTQWGEMKRGPGFPLGVRLSVTPSPSHYRFSTPSIHDAGEGLEIPRGEN